APTGHLHLLELLQRLQSELQHPLRFALHLRDAAHDIRVQTLPGLEDRLVLVAKTILVLADFRYLLRHRDNLLQNFLLQKMPPRPKGTLFQSTPSHASTPFFSAFHASVAHLMRAG